MCQGMKQVTQFLGSVREYVPTADTLCAIIWFVPSVYAGLFSIGSGFIIRQCVNHRDQLQAAEYAAHMAREEAASGSPPKTAVQVSKKPWHR
jgi:hypothetical protein